MDVRPAAEDLCRKAVVTASFGESFHEVYGRMQAHDLRAIPIVDADRRVEGVLSVLDVMGLFFANDTDPVK
ncbi:MAG: CBS domain-containing protein [Planctomycetota bacterium]